MSAGNHKPKSILKKSPYKPGKKRLFSKLNTLVYTNGLDRLAEEKIMTFVPGAYQLVPWRGVDKKKLEISDSILIDIGPEASNLPTINEFLVVKNGAAKNKSDNAKTMQKSTTISEFYSYERYSEQIEKIDLVEEKKKMVLKPTEDKCVTTEDITTSFPEMKHWSIKDIMSTKQLDSKSETSFFNCLKSNKRYRVPEIQVKKIEDKCPLTDTKRLKHITHFLDYNQGQFYEEYEVNDCLCDTEDLTKYFNFNNYSFEDLLSEKTHIQLENIQGDPIRLIDIKMKRPSGYVNIESEKNNTNSNKETQTKVCEQFMEKNCMAPNKIRPLPKVILANRRKTCLNDLIKSMDKKMDYVNKMAETIKNQFDKLKNDRKYDQHSDVSYQNWCNTNLYSHIDKYYSSSKLKYPSISKARRPKDASFINSYRSDSSFSLRHDLPQVEHQNEYKSFSVSTKKSRSSLPGLADTNQSFTFSKKSHDLVERSKNNTEYLIDSSFLFKCESELFETSTCIIHLQEEK